MFKHLFSVDNLILIGHHGSYGDCCRNPCPHHCLDRECDAYTGHCRGCFPGNYTQSCENTRCSLNFLKLLQPYYSLKNLLFSILLLINWLICHVLYAVPLSFHVWNHFNCKWSFLKHKKQIFTNNLHVLIEGKCDTTLVFITYIRVWKRQIVQNYDLNSLFIIMQR